MNVTPLQTLNEFAVIALAVAAAYLAAVWLAMIVVRAFRHFREGRHIVCRPGELVHQALKVSGRLWDHYRTAALLCGVSFVLLLNFGKPGVWAPLATFSNVLISLCLLPVVACGLLKLLQLTRYRFRLSRLLDMHMQIEKRLIDVQVRGNRIFPSVGIDDGMIDNVVVGRNGVYTVQLFPPPAGAESVIYKDGALVFAPGGQRISLRSYNASVRGLAERLGRQLSSAVQVLPVVVVPGCRIQPSEQQGPMLASYETCAGFLNWKGNDFFLLDDDVAAINVWLGQQTLKHPPQTLAAVVSSLQSQIHWPALIQIDRPAKRSLA